VARFGAAALVVVLAVSAAACGGSGDKKSDDSDLGKQAQAACTGEPLSAAPKLPASFPQIEAEKLTYTRQSTVGPTNVVEGFFNGDVKDAHDEFLKELKGAGFKILFNELEDHDSEISWQAEGRTGQVALREECGSSDKTYVHITNRAA
jgi:predicted outer membrane protein